MCGGVMRTTLAAHRSRQGVLDLSLTHLPMLRALSSGASSTSSSTANSATLRPEEVRVVAEDGEGSNSGDTSSHTYRIRPTIEWHTEYDNAIEYRDVVDSFPTLPVAFRHDADD